MYKPKPICATFRLSDSDQKRDRKFEHKLDGDHIDELDPEVMKEALAKIAQEVQRFTSGVEPDDLTDEVDMYKSKLCMKKKLIKNLRENLNTACVVAKTLTSSKEKECLALNKHLIEARNENLTLQKNKAENLELIQRLTKENHALSTKFEQLKTFIDLGYKELQKIRNQPIAENISIELSLKEILVSCGQFYADYRNEQEKNGQLDQKNRFLATRLCIIERDLDTAMDHLKKCGKTNCKVFPCQTIAKRRMNKVNSELNLRKLNDYGIVELGSQSYSDLDLSAHMSLVKGLLSDQDSMLGDLKQLSKELECLNS